MNSPEKEKKPAEEANVPKKSENPDIFLDSLSSLLTNSIAPKLPRKHPPISTYLIKGTIVLLLVAVMIFCIAQIVLSIRNYTESDDLYSQISDAWGSLDSLLSITPFVSKSSKNSHGSLTQNFGTPTIPEISVPGEDSEEISENLILLRAKFAALKELNPDVIAWITIPGTIIDYPVLQTSDNDYYIDHSITGTHLNSGAIFVDYRNSSDLVDSNTVIYGHNMTTGIMFADLADFKESWFFSTYKYIYLHTEEGTYVYTVFSAYETNKYNPYTRIFFNTSNDFCEWANNMYKASIYRLSSRKFTFDGDEKIITLSTCTNDFRNEGRFAVHAILTEIRR